jgi:hypothetical protein
MPAAVAAVMLAVAAAAIWAAVIWAAATLGAEVAVGVAWACSSADAADAADADPAGYGARLSAAGSTPVNLKARSRARQRARPLRQEGFDALVHHFLQCGNRRQRFSPTVHGGWTRRSGMTGSVCASLVHARSRPQRPASVIVIRPSGGGDAVVGNRCRCLRAYRYPDREEDREALLNF